MWIHTSVRHDETGWRPNMSTSMQHGTDARTHVACNVLHVVDASAIVACTFVACFAVYVRVYRPACGFTYAARGGLTARGSTHTCGGDVVTVSTRIIASTRASFLIQHMHAPESIRPCMQAGVGYEHGRRRAHARIHTRPHWHLHLHLHLHLQLQLQLQRTVHNWSSA